jgi:hypothetical protein
MYVEQIFDLWRDSSFRDAVWELVDQSGYNTGKRRRYIHAKVWEGLSLTLPGKTRLHYLFVAQCIVRQEERLYQHGAKHE